MPAAAAGGAVFCDKCGSSLNPPLYWCDRCEQAPLLTGGVLLKQLEKILKDERKAEHEGKGKGTVEATVETVSGDMATLRCTPPLFDEGDVVARIDDRAHRPLGTVVVRDKFLLIKLFDRAEVKEGEVLLLREAEQLVAYDLQLNLLETYASASARVVAARPAPSGGRSTIGRQALMRCRSFSAIVARKR